MRNNYSNNKINTSKNMTNNLPQGWVECELKDIVSYKKGKKPLVLSTENKQNYLPYVDIKCFEKGIVELYTPKDEGVLIDKNNILVVWDGARAGLCGRYNRGVLGSTIMSLNTSINIVFLENFIKSKYNILNKNTKGTGIPHVKPDLFWSLKVSLPPLNEQKRIVEKIENEFEKIDEGIEKLKIVQEQINQYKQSVLKSAFEGKLYKTTDWEEKKLKDITTKISDGSHNPPPKQEFGVPMLSGRNIKNGKINFDEYRYITESEFQSEIKRTPIEAGDILLTIVGTIGETAVVPENSPKFAIQRSVALLKPQISSFYLKYYLDSPIAFSYYKKNEKGTAQKGIYLETLKNMIIKLPIDKDAQQKIVAEIEKRFEVADEVAKVVQENLEQAEQLKQSILKKAFEGRLVSQDPTDEPASVLLERIKKERNKK